MLPWAVAPPPPQVASIAVVAGITATGLLDGVAPLLALIVAEAPRRPRRSGCCFYRAADSLGGTPSASTPLAATRSRKLVARDDAVALVDGPAGSVQDLEGAELPVADRRAA